MPLYPLGKEDLVVDIGSNDGTLLGNFQKGGHRVCGVEPTNAYKIARGRGHPDDQRVLRAGGRGARCVEEHGAAKIVTATNVFAHIEDVHEIVDSDPVDAR